MKKQLIVKLLCCFLMVSLFLTYETVSFPLVAEAHSGRTDSNGGHHDYKNKSGLGSYHYHCGGYPAHLHTNGICPYAAQSTNTAPSGSGGGSSNSSTNNASAPEPIITGWNQDTIGWRYYVLSGAFYRNGFVSIDEHTYYFDNDGYILTGWQSIDSHWYYFDSNSRMVTGWQYLNDIWYYFDNSGYMQSGFQQIEDEWYYFDDNGHMVTGSIAIDGTEYYFDSDGTLDGEYEWWKSND